MIGRGKSKVSEIQYDLELMAVVVKEGIMAEVMSELMVKD